MREHPGAGEICGRLLGWLHEVGCGDEVDPIERDLLATPHKRLGPRLRMDANWAGEKGAVFCWMLGVGEAVVGNRADQSKLPWLPYLLKREAVGMIEAATLRDGAEIKEACRQFVLIQLKLRESRIDEKGREILRRLALNDLAQVGVEVTEGELERASRAVSEMSPEARKAAAAIYFVRAHAGMWFLKGGGRYFG